MRTFVQTIFILAICSCSQDKQTTVKNPFDSTVVINLSPTIPTNTFVFSCGTAELAQKMFEDMNRSNKYEKQMTCSEYTIKKKGFFAFIDNINKTDSFKITNFEPPWVNWSPAKPDDTDSSEKNYVFISCFPEKVYILKTTRQDSFPLKLSFTSDYEGTITMKMCTDTSLSKKLSNILIGGNLAKRKLGAH